MIKVSYYSSIDGWARKTNFQHLVIKIIDDNEIIFSDEYKIRYFIEDEISVSNNELLNYVLERDDKLAQLYNKATLIEYKFF